MLECGREDSKKKCIDKEFINYIGNFEVMGLVKTWVTDGESFNIIGFKGFLKEERRKEEGGGTQEELP